MLCCCFFSSEANIRTEEAIGLEANSLATLIPKWNRVLPLAIGFPLTKTHHTPQKRKKGSLCLPPPPTQHPCHSPGSTGAEVLRPKPPGTWTPRAPCTSFQKQVGGHGVPLRVGALLGNMGHFPVCLGAFLAFSGVGLVGTWETQVICERHFVASKPSETMLETHEYVARKMVLSA